MHNKDIDKVYNLQANSCGLAMERQDSHVRSKFSCCGDRPVNEPVKSDQINIGSRMLKSDQHSCFLELFRFDDS